MPTNSIKISDLAKMLDRDKKIIREAVKKGNLTAGKEKATVLTDDKYKAFVESRLGAVKDTIIDPKIASDMNALKMLKLEAETKIKEHQLSVMSGKLVEKELVIGVFEQHITSLVNKLGVEFKNDIINLIYEINGRAYDRNDRLIKGISTRSDHILTNFADGLRKSFHKIKSNQSI